MDLSVIIPTYREDSNTLNRCLDSLLFLNNICQWEAWIVDDGNPSGMVSRWVAERHDPHINVITQANQGQSIARNTGIEHANGQYVMMVDADDELIADGFTRLWNLIESKHPDLIGHWFDPQGKSIYEGDALTYMEQHDIIPAACGYVIKRSILKDLRYTPGIVHEDEEFNALLHLRASTLLMSTYRVYEYHQNEGSTMLAKNREHLEKRFHDVDEVIKHLRNHIDKKNKKALERRILVLAMCQLVNLIRRAYDTTQLVSQIKALGEMELYPLPYDTSHSIKRYRWIRLATYKPTMVKALWYIFRITIRH